MVIPFANVVIPPIWGFAADAYRIRLPLLRLAATGSALTCLLLLTQHGFFATLAVVALFSLFRAPLTSLADAASVASLDGRSHEFSRIRVFGSIGFGLFVATLGWLDATNHPSLLIASTAVVYLLATATTLSLSTPSTVSKTGMSSDVRRVLGRPSVLVFLAMSAVYYAGHAIFDVYFGLRMASLGLGDSVVGAGWAIGIASEIMVLLLAPRFFRFVRMEIWLTVCAVAAALRWLGIAALSCADALLALQSLHGITFGLWYLSLVTFVQTRADENSRTSLQAIALSCTGIGSSFASVLGGNLLSHHGARTPFHMAAVCAGIAAFGYAMLAITSRNQNQPHRDISSSE